ncbi:hypothetical protein [Longimicrobium sp.]|uniref:hypothetical protein n=1 Tax=Longimicrobium sp. TaxID=2029185 RepID=UPI002EDB775D
MIEHSRTLAPGWTEEQLELTEAHVREHLASIADADDDPSTQAEDVRLTRRREEDGGLTIVGYLDAEPNAPYLQPGYDPDAEARPDWLTWTPADQPDWDPHAADPAEPEEPSK